MHPLLLASTSSSRYRMLAGAGVAVEVVAPEVNEDPGGRADPAALASHLARRKAGAVAARHPDRWVLGADQVGTLLGADAVPFGKPRDTAHHLALLQSLRGRTHALVTGFALLGPGIEHVETARTRLHVRGDLTDAELRAYVETGEGTYCAGGYAIEGRGAFLFAAVEGDFFNVLGLPLLRVLDALRAHGWRFGDG